MILHTQWLTFVPTAHTMLENSFSADLERCWGGWVGFSSSFDLGTHEEQPPRGECWVTLIPLHNYSTCQVMVWTMVFPSCMLFHLASLGIVQQYNLPLRERRGVLAQSRSECIEVSFSKYLFTGTLIVPSFGLLFMTVVGKGKPHWGELLRNINWILCWSYLPGWYQ